MRYESSIEAQRHKELLADNNSLHSIPKLMVDRAFERYGTNIYTHENFYIFQKKLWIACVDCTVENKKEEDGLKIYHIIDSSEANSKLREVVYDSSHHSANLHVGILIYNKSTNKKLR